MFRIGQMGFNPTQTVIVYRADDCAWRSILAKLAACIIHPNYTEITRYDIDDTLIPNFWIYWKYCFVGLAVCFYIICPNLITLLHPSSFDSRFIDANDMIPWKSKKLTVIRFLIKRDFILAFYQIILTLCRHRLTLFFCFFVTD